MIFESHGYTSHRRDSPCLDSDVLCDSVKVEVTVVYTKQN